MSWKTVFSDKRIWLVIVLSLLALGLIFLRDLNPSTVDLNLGIEFIGGVRIPITLEHSVDIDTMSSMVETIKLRVNKFGLSQAIVRPLGNKEIIVEIPKADASVIKSIEEILRAQGKFEAVVDGKLALSGSDILSNAVGGAGGENVVPVEGDDNRARWELVFAISGEGEQRFAEAASGKLRYPVYMFLDRPENAVLLLYEKDLGVATAGQTVITDALVKEGDDLLLYYVREFQVKKTEIAALNRTVLIASEELKELNPEIVSELKEMGFSELEAGVFAEEVVEKRLVFKTKEEVVPEIISAPVGAGGLPQTILVSWQAIGLMSAPTLQVEPIKQAVITQYKIEGSVFGNSSEEARQNAVTEIKQLKSVLSGGRLPVSTVIGSYYDIAPSLGKQFLFYSIVGLFLAVVAVAIVIVLRYRRIKLILPIVATNVVELLLLVSLIGGFGTLDLSAMAGVITLIGTGVDDQIIITEELLVKRKRGEGEVFVPERSTKERIARAFFVVFVAAGVAIASMLPLLVSGIVEVMGFALATILGILIGVGVTRPAFGVIAGELFKDE